jgi:hypothetical protein
MNAVRVQLPRNDDEFRAENPHLYDEYGLIARLNAQRPGDLPLMVEGFRYRNRADQFLRCHDCQRAVFITNASLDGEPCPWCHKLMPPTYFRGES